jgi:hypothetical protein
MVQAVSASLIPKPWVQKPPTNKQKHAVLFRISKALKLARCSSADEREKIVVHVNNMTFWKVKLWRQEI